jgi:hypothetical protein
MVKRRIPGSHTQASTTHRSGNSLLHFTLSVQKLIVWERGLANEDIDPRRGGDIMGRMLHLHLFFSPHFSFTSNSHSPPTSLLRLEHPAYVIIPQHTSFHISFAFIYHRNNRPVPQHLYSLSLVNRCAFFCTLFPTYTLNKSLSLVNRCL